MQFSCLFGKKPKGEPGAFSAYVAVIAKRLYLTEKRKDARAINRHQKIIERQKRLEKVATGSNFNWEALEDLDIFCQKLKRLLAASVRITAPKYLNALLDEIRVRWPNQLGEPLPPFPGIAPPANEGTRRCYISRARKNIKGLVPDQKFTDLEMALLYALGIVLKSRRRRNDGGSTT